MLVAVVVREGKAKLDGTDKKSKERAGTITPSTDFTAPTSC